MGWSENGGIVTVSYDIFMVLGSHGMTTVGSYVIRRGAYMILLLWLISIVSFTVIQLRRVTSSLRTRTSSSWTAMT